MMKASVGGMKGITQATGMILLLLGCNAGSFTSGGAKKSKDHQTLPGSGNALPQPTPTPTPGGTPASGSTPASTTCDLVPFSAKAQAFVITSSPNEIYVPFVIRDFTPDHPDFEHEGGDVIKGLVEPVLDAEARPVFTGKGGGSIASKESFGQWYRDVPGVNKTIRDFSLRLTRVGNSDIFEFKDSAFFPIDKQGFGNQEHPHNYHFTGMIDSDFTYQGGEVFDFKGDDDVWVFIDERLVIDLGGIHAEKPAKVKLDELQPKLEKGKDYKLRIFYAERHVYGSNLKIETSIKIIDTRKLFEYDVSKHANEQTVSYELVEAPAGMSIDQKSGLLRWTPTSTDAGDHKAIVRLQGSSEGCQATGDVSVTIQGQTP